MMEPFMFEQSVEEIPGQEMDTMMAGHAPVMSEEVMTYLNPPKGGVFVDCTLGLGGHAQAVLNALGPQGRLIGIDRDAQSLQAAKENLKSYLSQCDFIREDFRNVDKVLEGLKIQKVDGILLDLGISSFQLDDPRRGFSFQTEGPLDMRMDQQGCISAFDLINSLSEKELSLILKDYGEERWHNRIARRIVAQRAKGVIETTSELRDIVFQSIPRHGERGKIHPATRTFQAFRIAVNRELESLDLALDKCVGSLSQGGRMGVIAFHSLEDRIVKHKFRALAKAGTIELTVKKPLRPTPEESQRNPRARSARLRIVERI